MILLSTSVPLRIAVDALRDEVKNTLQNENGRRSAPFFSVNVRK